MKGKVVAFINMKGGVGKTTLCIGIAEYLAHQMDKKVLLIDLDPQFNTTQSIMNLFDLEDEYLNKYTKQNITVTRLFENPTKVADRPKLPSKEEIIIHLDESMEIIPGTIDLIFEDNNKNTFASKRVKKFIDENELKNVYDYIFIDCPPTISLYTDAALIASDFYLVPIKIDRYAILGMTLLQQVIERLAYEQELNIKPLGKIYTMVDENVTDKTKVIIDLLESNVISNEIKSFNASTHFVRDLMVGLQGNISSKYVKSKEDINKICIEFVERIENYDE